MKPPGEHISQQESLGSKKDKMPTSPTAKAALLAAALSMGSFQAHAESPKLETSGSDEPTTPYVAVSFPTAAEVVEMDQKFEREQWQKLNESMNVPASSVQQDGQELTDLAPTERTNLAEKTQDSGAFGPSERNENVAWEIMNTMKDESGLDGLLIQSREKLNQGLNSVFERIPGAGYKTRLLGDMLVTTTTELLELELSIKLSQTIENHLSRDNMLDSARQFVPSDFKNDYRNPDNMALGKTWGSEEGNGKGWSLRVGADMLNVHFDPSVGVKFEKRF